MCCQETDHFGINKLDLYLLRTEIRFDEPNMESSNPHMTPRATKRSSYAAAKIGLTARTYRGHGL